MSRRIETKIETIEHKVNIIACDICHEEVSYSEIPVFGSDFQAMSEALSHTSWWRKPFDRIVGIKKGYRVDGIEDNPDFEVHVGCVYELIRKATKK